MNKTSKILFAVVCLFAFATIGFVNASEKRTLQQVNLLYSTSENPDKWLPAPGNQISDFKLTLDPSIEYYYFDIKFIKPTLPEGIYVFRLDPPDNEAFWDYWDDKGVNSGAPFLIPNPNPPPSMMVNWKHLMWKIISNEPALGVILPMFGLYSDGAGDYQIRDGLIWYYSGHTVQTDLRVNGDYPPGIYTFICYGAEGPLGEITILDDFAISITFR